MDTIMTGLISLFKSMPHAKRAIISLSLERRRNPKSMPNIIDMGNTNTQNVGSNKMANLPSSENFIPTLSRSSKSGNRLPRTKSTLSAEKEKIKGRAISLKSILDNKDMGLHI
jgi:hypothetical protein